MVGLLRLNGKTHNLSCRRGSIGVQVTSTSTAEDIISSAVVKHHIFSELVSDDPSAYVLLFPDKSQVVKIPGLESPFVLSRYKEAIGKSYTKLLFHLCLKEDFRGNSTKLLITLTLDLLIINLVIQ